MIRTIEAIGITREFARDAYEIDPSDPDFYFYLETVARNIFMQAEHLENTSRALVEQAKQLKADIGTRLES